jgi:hypothetical protein
MCPASDIKGFLFPAFHLAHVACRSADARPRIAFANVHERSTAHRLAVHLNPVFPSWNKPLYFPAYIKTKALKNLLYQRTTYRYNLHKLKIILPIQKKSSVLQKIIFDIN